MADMTSKERVMCALAGKKPDRVPFAEPPVDPKVLNALFGDKGLTDPIFVADALGTDMVSFRFMPPLFVEEVELPDGRTHQTSGKLYTRADLKLLETLEDPTNDALYSDLEKLVEKAGDRVCLVGNVSVDVLARGTEEEAKADVRRCLEQGAPGGGYMISSSNSIPSYARPENVLAMVDAIREYNTN